MVTLPYTVNPTLKARTLFTLMVVAAAAIALAAAWVTARFLMPSGTVEIWDCGPSPIYNGTECAWGGNEALYEGNPWYYGVIPFVLTFSFLLLVSRVVAEKYNLITWKEEYAK